jgi:ATPase subunit of ABC transporter with duplicated ATPase domains
MSSTIEAQLTSLDDTDCYASVWSEILARQENGGEESKNSWGGRGRGGRGLARRTIQPKDVVVDSVRLQYLRGDAFLEGATLKLLQQRVYALIGKNGCGKSTLLQRMHAKKIPGWSTQWTTLYLPPELPERLLSKRPLDVILDYHGELHKNSVTVTELRIAELEEQLDSLNSEEEQEQVETLCEELSELEDQLNFDQSTVEQQARQALHTFGLDDANLEAVSCEKLSRGQQKYVLLSVAMVCSFPNLLLLDEPTNGLDIYGLIQLRRLIEEATATVVMVSHDVDLINDVATDIITMEGQSLRYYPGNYDSYCLMKDQQGLHELRQSIAMEKKKGQLVNTLHNLKEQHVAKKGGSKKKAKAISSHKKKLERHETAEKAANANSTTAVLPPRKGVTAAQRLKLAESMKSVPDKSVQFM